MMVARAECTHETLALTVTDFIIECMELSSHTDGRGMWWPMCCCMKQDSSPVTGSAHTSPSEVGVRRLDTCMDL